MPDSMPMPANGVVVADAVRVWPIGVLHVLATEAEEDVSGGQASRLRRLADHVVKRAGQASRSVTEL